MGSQGSKLGHRKEDMLPKLPPVLSRKLEEIKRRRAAGTTLSKKQLLKDGFEDDSFTNGPRSTVSSPAPDDDSVKSANVAQEPMDTPIFSDEEEVIAEEKSKEHDNKVNDNGEDHKTEALTTTMEKLAMEEPEDNKKVVEEHGSFNNVERPLSLMICPGSPSFRFYLTENEKDNDSSRDDYTIKGSLSDTDVDAADESVQSRTSTEEMGSKIKKRGRRGMMRFRMGKNLLKVKSCYYPSCGGRHEISRRLITQKSATL